MIIRVLFISLLCSALMCEQPFLSTSTQTHAAGEDKKTYTLRYNDAFFTDVLMSLRRQKKFLFYCRKYL